MTNQHTAPDRRIVVGVDGSTGSKAALLWAVEQVERTGATVEAVSAWQESVFGGYAVGWAPMAYNDETLAAIAEKALADAVAEVVARFPSAVDIVTRVMHGHPVDILLSTAEGADLLVVSSRGFGTFGGILLGSVSQHCVQHAPCPVVVVPP